MTSEPMPRPRRGHERRLPDQTRGARPRQRRRDRGGLRCGRDRRGRKCRRQGHGYRGRDGRDRG
ncbi:MAG: hypothetical protein FIB00_14885 [Chloroflexi bacterium]|nr:hypothetical protein [Chloroflexota bacterium]